MTDTNHETAVIGDSIPVVTDGPAFDGWRAPRTDL